MTTLVIVDAQNDFIRGSLACEHAEEAIENLVDLIQTNPTMKVYYTGDCHSKKNGSFKENGGIWPVHCVEDTWGAKLDEKFSSLKNPEQKPNENNVFLKGRRDDVEEYAACKGMNQRKEYLEDVLDEEVYVAGLASEYCVRETILGLKEKGLKVTLYLPGVGYVDKKDHEANLEDLSRQGIQSVTTL